MTRFLVQVLLPLLLPVLIFLVWAWLSSRSQDKGSLVAKVQNGPWFWLIVAGFVLMLGAVTYTALTSGGEPGETYTPPRLEDGRVVPGRFD